MASRAETSAVYGAGIVQGIALVTFPAASTILTDPAEYDLSSTQYAALFLPQVITAIAASLLGARLADRFGIKRVYLAGLVAGLLSMSLLILSQFFTSDQSLAYAMLLVATACLGAGFGLTVPALNIFAAAFHPAGVDRAILVLNALLGLGTVLAPVFVAIFVGLGFWWGMPRDVGGDAARAAARQPAAAAAGPGARARPGRRQAAAAGAVLGLRGVRRPLRHLRDAERQLVAAGHDERARRPRPPRLRWR